MTELVLGLSTIIGGIIVAYVTYVLPNKVKRTKEVSEEILSEIKKVSDKLVEHEKSNNEQLGMQSEALMLMMRSNLHSRYDKLKEDTEDNGFPPKEDIRDWWERYDSYKKLGGNHSVDRLADDMINKGWIE